LSEGLRLCFLCKLFGGNWYDDGGGGGDGDHDGGDCDYDDEPCIFNLILK